jgi:alpha-1,2-mannosyltransferase
MAGFIDILRSGAWLTRERVRLIALAVLAASAIGAGFLIATATGLNDQFGRPLGTDFASIYAAGHEVLEGHPLTPFDLAAHYAREQAIFGAAVPLYSFHYPPFYLGIGVVLALMPYLLALAVWQAVTLAFYLWTTGAILSTHLPPSELTKANRYLWLLLAIAFPAVFINFGHGHNGFLTATLFAGGLLTLERRPIVAGILFGCLVYKPQFGVLIPVALMASGRWRAIASAAATVIALVIAATLAFGPDVWTAFMGTTKFTREVVLETNEIGWHKIQSVFSWVRLWNGSIPLAYAVQGAVSLIVAASVAWLWRGRAAYPVKAAMLMIGTLLATPYALDYDLMLLVPAIAFLAADGRVRGFAPWEKTTLAALWIVPLVARSVPEMTLIPLVTPLLLAAFGLLLHRAITEAGPAQASGIFRRAP